MTNNNSNKYPINKIYRGSFSPVKNRFKTKTTSLIFAFNNGHILLKSDNIPTYNDLVNDKITIANLLSFGTIKNTDCHFTNLHNNIDLPNNYHLVELRKAYTILNEDELKAAMFAHQISIWHKKTKFCGACAHETILPESDDWHKQCPNCNETYFPKISPAAIVAISRNGKLLMALHSKYKFQRYTVLAGFVNAGESLEECVHREVFEEAGIKIKNLKYFGSQPWPFPDSLMIGFTAEYESGELAPEESEIIDLKWVTANKIEKWPNRSSISRALIDDFIEKNKQSFK